MKSVRLAFVLLGIILTLMCVHAFFITDLSRDLSAHIGAETAAVSSEEWGAAETEAAAVRERFERSGFWAKMTMSAAQTDEIEASLARSEAYLAERAKTALLAELTNLRLLTQKLIVSG